MSINHKVKEIILRYSIILILSLFYPFLNVIFSIPTIYASYGLISLFYPVSLLGNILSFNNIQVELIDACIAGLAYLLLIVLNLASQMPLKTRIKALSFGLFTFFVFNILRISLLALLFSSNSQMFSYVHTFFWYFGSVLAVFLIWVFSINLFKIKNNPFTSDIKFILKNTKN